MARRVARDARISPLYAMNGPLRSHTLRVCEGDSELARRMRANWQAWHNRYAPDWANGRAVPGPPHADVLDTYAKPTS